MGREGEILIRLHTTPPSVSPLLSFCSLPSLLFCSGYFLLLFINISVSSLASPLQPGGSPHPTVTIIQSFRLSSYHSDPANQFIHYLLISNTLWTLECRLCRLNKPIPILRIANKCFLPPRLVYNKITNLYK